MSWSVGLSVGWSTDAAGDFWDNLPRNDWAAQGVDMKLKTNNDRTPHNVTQTWLIQEIVIT